MAKIAIIGAGFAGHTTALYLGHSLGKKHDITVINKFENFVFIPSLVWVGVDQMKPEKVHIPLKRVYDKFHINFIHGAATEIHPDENFVVVNPAENGQSRRVDYDYLVIATGPHLNFEGTPGLGPEHHTTYSICNVSHAIEARDKYLESVERMKRGERQKIVVGTGHSLSACQGAAFEYISNIHHDLVRQKVRDKAELLWLSNEPALGDFGVRGLKTIFKKRIVSGEEFIKAIFRENNISWEVQKGVQKVDKERIYWEDYEGNNGETGYDYAMLIPQFKGVRFKYIGKNGEDVSEQIENPAGFIKVDGIYGLDYPTLAANPDAWPSQYFNPTYKNIFAPGISFAPPGPISVPHTTPNGTSITAMAPRTGMVSGITGRVVAKNIIDLVNGKHMSHKERMSEMAAACIASMGNSMFDGSAATILLYPVVPDPKRFPNEEGRDLFVTHMEAGLAGAWMKRLIHTTFMYKFHGYPGWRVIPE